MKDLFWVEIDLAAIDHNVTQYKNLLEKSAEIVCVVKSNAYGHGLVDIAKRLEKDGIQWLGVVNIMEALELRDAGITAHILVLGYTPRNWFQKAAEQNISVSMYNKEDLISYTGKQPLNVHIKVDTGLCRMGFWDEEFIQLIPEIKKNAFIHVEGVWSHLADAENPASYHTNVQIERFNTVIEPSKKAFGDTVLFHLGASAATLLFPEARLNLVRVGVSLYGLWASDETLDVADSMGITKTFSLKPALSYKTKLVQVKKVPQGALIGYGCTYRVRKETTIGVVPVGYAEGLPRLLSNKGYMLIQGKKVQIVGNVCMNMTMIDLTEVDAPKVGDEVVIIGAQGNEVITAEDHATWTNTINYEVTTRIPPRVPRLYICS